MKERFTKLLHSLPDSSVWSYDSDTRVVWVTLLAMADEDGVVHASVSGISRRAIVSLERTIAALETFQKPDPDSRHIDDEEGTGARLAKVDGGYLLLGYKRIRDANLDDLEKRRATDRARQARHRGSPSRDTNVSHVDSRDPLFCSDLPSENPSSNGEGERGEEEGSGEEKGVGGGSKSIYERVQDAWNEICGDVLPKVTKLTAARKAAIRNRLEDVDGFDALVVVFQRVRASDFLTGKSKARDGGAPFRTFFDWVMGPKNFVKVVEGNYDNRGRGKIREYDRGDLDSYDDMIEEAT